MGRVCYCLDFANGNTELEDGVITLLGFNKPSDQNSLLSLFPPSPLIKEGDFPP